MPDCKRRFAPLCSRRGGCHVVDNMPDRGRGSNIETIDDALAVIIGATRLVSIEAQKQPTLTEF
jgi:hypothetical protein